MNPRIGDIDPTWNFHEAKARLEEAEQRMRDAGGSYQHNPYKWVHPHVLNDTRNALHLLERAEKREKALREIIEGSLDEIGTSNTEMIQYWREMVDIKLNAIDHPPPPYVTVRAKGGSQ
jgi:hypothetical protein